ncbi:MULTISPECIES: hypothetical protein [unclassified Rothia (in: high G+C Gram-positive bacteria)]|uniref:hypothetical protein n=1 Tax=unclassified Rothia (in: high G+C Gram-positive bacteria) TaxID=2689056 RepID=UPI00195E90DB|nr:MULTISPECIES: hypothetical protein [unclassified Rothia (in: high G+C Gram-positive bacteria)]MBM7051835.1 hypothetical protein [Rothia sp. ZJ1223]QRZ61550.1 hypothetical protein JR346_10140 [Rothia sp. ZJ932]
MSNYTSTSAPTTGRTLGLLGIIFTLIAVLVIWVVTLAPLFDPESEMWLFVSIILMPSALPGYMMLILAAGKGYRSTLAKICALAVPLTAGLLGLMLLWFILPSISIL